MERDVTAVHVARVERSDVSPSDVSPSDVTPDVIIRDRSDDLTLTCHARDVRTDPRPDVFAGGTRQQHERGRREGVAAQVRLIHAAPGAGALDVLLVGAEVSQPLVENVRYAHVTPFHRFVPTGSVTLVVRARGAGARNGDTMLDLACTVEPGRAYTIVAARPAEDAVHFPHATAMGRTDGRSPASATAA